MDLKAEKSIKLLNLSIPFSLNDLKRNYYKLSLKLHPDKNNSPNATSEFQELKDAYEYLNETIYDYSTLNESENDYDFFEILNNFTSNITGKKIDKSIIVNIIEKISENKTVLYKELFEGIDKQTSIDLFEYLKKYSELFNISYDTLVKIGDIINEKFKHDEIIKLHPNINNLMNDDIYKLELNTIIYYIPLWHHEIMYDLSLNNQLIINVIPELDHHISIDDYNNIHVHLTKNIKVLLTIKTIVFNIGDKVFDIPCEELYIKKKQKYIYKRKGISKIDTKDVYDVTKRGDVIVHLTLLDI
jgi:hypothetical protein